MSYGASEADETTDDRNRRSFSDVLDTANNINCTSNTPTANAVCRRDGSGIESLSSLTFGVYHDVTSWFKVIAEYTKVEDEWHDGRDREADVFAVGGFFLW